MKRLLLPLLLCVAARPAFAQTAAAGGTPGTATTSARVPYETVKDYLLRAADQMPEASYAYRPTAKVRTFGQILGHVAGSHYAFCGAALGQPRDESDEYEKLTSKKALVDALRKSFDYCDAALKMGDAEATASIKLFGQNTTRLGALIFNIGHDFEHYGNLVTYMRMKGLVPPSSQPQARS